MTNLWFADRQGDLCAGLMMLMIRRWS